MKKIGIWIRVSTLDQKRGDSPEIHEKRARMYAESKGWEIVTIYHLEGISGKSTLHQKEAVRMIEDVRSGKINGLIFSKLARLGRNTKELLEFSEVFNESDASMISLQESIDTSTPAGKLFYTIIGAMAQWEREEISERVKASIITRRKLGKLTNGATSYGFKIEDGKIVLNKKEAPVRKLMYELFLEHKRRATTARLLNEMGYRTRKGYKFSDTSVTRMLKNSDAKGIKRTNYYGTKTTSNPSGIKPKDEWHFMKIPRIVSDKLWNSVNAIIEEQEQKSNQTKPLNQRVHLFTSYIYCHNGHKMGISTKINKYSCPKCKIRIDKDDLEQVFQTRLKQFVMSKKEVQKYAKSTDKIINDKEIEVNGVTFQIEEIKQKMDKLIELSIAGQIPTKDFDRHYSPLSQQLESLNKTLDRLEKELTDMNTINNSLGKVINQSKSIYEKWDAFDRIEKRSIIESVTNKIIFDGKLINFKLKQIAPLSSLELGKNAQQAGTILLPGIRLQKLLKSMSPKEMKLPLKES